MASKGVNKVILVGNLGQDPEVRYMPNGGAVANISLATSESWKDKNTGQMQEKTEWHRVTLFGKLAEVAGEYLRKGSQVYIEGQLQTRKWQDQSGQDRYSTDIVVQGFNGVMQMLGGRSGGDNQQGGFQPKAPAPQAGFQQQQAAPAAAPQQGGYQQQQAAPAPQGGFQQQQAAPTPQGGFQQQQAAPAPQGGFQPQQAAPAPQGGFQQQQAAAKPAEPSMDFDDDIPF